MRLQTTRRSARAFSLIELVIVIVIIGILAAIAVPRLSRGAVAAGQASLSADLSAMRKAIDLFYAEHGMSFPSLLKFEGLMTQYSDATGTKFGDLDTAQGVIYGPYLRAIPPLPVGVNVGKNAVVAAFNEVGGWVYDPTNGSIKPNCKPGEVDDKGKKYVDY
jgi:general secretion pathway protein G